MRAPWPSTEIAQARSCSSPSRKARQRPLASPRRSAATASRRRMRQSPANSPSPELTQPCASRAIASLVRSVRLSVKRSRRLSYSSAVRSRALTKRGDVRAGARRSPLSVKRSAVSAASTGPRSCVLCPSASISWASSVPRIAVVPRARRSSPSSRAAPSGKGDSRAIAERLFVVATSCAAPSNSPSSSSRPERLSAMNGVSACASNVRSAGAPLRLKVTLGPMRCAKVCSAGSESN